ncbi:hypothetical protein [Sphingobacterium griseoflavum]|uniref:Uncharacterized protein n=1 Tax=Sphingobacterium griseoflavum TaxID=1474952 RepID=A0ABQ3HUG0_9SPHI|nr:hypothetical protein [Sphingobacterium griseoflavum]GHE32763.1 hypothetical protein GCM10017764_14670 [Sphingobacterium griseoflavum]
MKKKATFGAPLVMVMMDTHTPNGNALQKKGEEIPEPDERDKFPDEGDEVENLPPLQPDVDPIKRENPDVEELEENEELHTDQEDAENSTNIAPTGQTIVVDRRTGKDEL